MKGQTNHSNTENRLSCQHSSKSSFYFQPFLGRILISAFHHDNHEACTTSPIVPVFFLKGNVFPAEQGCPHLSAGHTTSCSLTERTELNSALVVRWSRIGEFSGTSKEMKMKALWSTKQIFNSTYGLNVSVSPKFICWKLTDKVMVLWGWALGEVIRS